MRIFAVLFKVFMKYIYQNTDWPNFIWDTKKVLPILAQVRNLQGKILGKMELLGFSVRKESTLIMLTNDVLKSTEIEGVILQREEVRSSIARKLGMDIVGLKPSGRDVDGIVEVMIDATQHCLQVLTKERLFSWHAALFPTGRSGMYKITVGGFRNDKTGPMQVVSGALGKERVHFVAPSSEVINNEIELFLKWFNAKDELDAIMKSAISHFWFITLHPFDDGNGRIARAIADMQLAISDETSQRFYSMSSQIESRKKEYYHILEKCQKGNIDITDWILWYCECLKGALESTEVSLQATFKKAKFWELHAQTPLNKRQVLMINKLFDDFFGKLSTSKWAKMTKCSRDTALRDIQFLMKKNILEKEEGGGRSTTYVLGGF